MPQDHCRLMFPGAFSEGSTPGADATNAQYGGWDLEVTNLFFANGQRACFIRCPASRDPWLTLCVPFTGDPWRDATVSADGLGKASTATQPIAVSDGFHCSDLITEYGEIDATIGAVQQQALDAMASWLSSA